MGLPFPIPAGVTGILHGGAHLAEEADDYAAAGVTHVTWFEPQREACAAMARAARPGATYVNVALGVRREQRALYLATNGQSASLLPPKMAPTRYPGVRFEGVEVVAVERLDDIALVRSDYQMLVLDVQGGELDALVGATGTLRSLRYVQCEITTEELYEGGATFGALHRFKGVQGFDLSAHFFWPGYNEGEALWVRR